MKLINVMKNGKVKFANVDAKKSADTDATDAKEIERGEKKVDEMKFPHYVYVMELIKETIGMMHFREVEKKFDARMTHEMNEVMEEQGWVSLIDVEMKEVIGGDGDWDVD